MAIVKFSITPAASAELHGAIQCLSRFSEVVCLEVREELFTLSTLNASKSAHAAVSFGIPFFLSYEFAAPLTQLDSKFTCSITSKALSPVFKSRSSDAKSSNTLERCDVTIHDGVDAARCRLVVKNICSNGVVKTMKLLYEGAEVMHALFDKNAAINRWSIQASVLKENLDHFSPRVEQLDIHHVDDKMAFLSFTEKVVSAKNEILKQPLKTTVIFNTDDFDHLDVQQELHIVISVKDFRAIVLHADTIGSTIRASYSIPGRPLQFQYARESMNCQYTLMTAGEYRGLGAQNIRSVLSKDDRQKTATSSKIGQQSSKDMPPPSVHILANRRSIKTLGRRQTQDTQSSRDSEPLFVEQEDSDWDPPNYEEQEETLGWNPAEETVSCYTPGNPPGSNPDRNLCTVELFGIKRTIIQQPLFQRHNSRQLIHLEVKTIRFSSSQHSDYQM